MGKRDKNARKPQPEGPRLLARGGGYTDDPKMALGKRRAIAGDYGEAEPEAVDEDTLKAFATDAHVRDADAKVDELIDMQAKTIANKIAKLQRQAAENGIDLAPMLREFLTKARQEIISARKAA